VQIVESESEEFLEVVAHLEAFKMTLISLKDDIKGFQERFVSEKERTRDVLNLLKA
jgi:hypothetical protein